MTTAHHPGRRRLTRTDEENLVAKYPDYPGTVDQLADEFGISRQTLYRVLQRNGLSPQRYNVENNLGTHAMANDARDKMDAIDAQIHETEEYLGQLQEAKEKLGQAIELLDEISLGPTRPTHARHDAGGPR